jgi:hypothetical protein
VSGTQTVERGVAPESTPPGRRSRLSIVVLVLSVLSLALIAPAATAMWSTLRHWGSSANGSGATDAGYVTVTHCSRRALAVTWECQGTFRVDDPYDGGQIERDVRVPNDFQRHSVGDQIGVALIRGDRTGYYWDFRYATEVLVGTIGAGLCLAGAMGILVTTHRRSRRWATGIALLGVVLALPVALNVVGLTHTTARINYGVLPAPRVPSTAPG